MNENIETRLAYLGFRNILPSPALRPYVASFWLFRREAILETVHEEYMHPRGGYGICFNFGDSLRLDKEALSQPIFLDGSNTISRKMAFSGRIDLLGIRFVEGGAYPFFDGVPLSELRNEVAVLDTDSRISLLELYAKLYERQSLQERIDLLEKWLFAQLEKQSDINKLIPRTLKLLQSSVGQMNILSLAEEFAISQRQLERVYQEKVGVSPKHYARLLRVDAARQALKAQVPSSIIAQDFGFYDQAHFIREFQSVVGMTPHRYAKRSLNKAKIKGE